jgi:hypothetical protein
MRGSPTGTGGRHSLAVVGVEDRMMTSYDDDMRTIVDLPEDQVRALAEVSRREKISRAEAVRRAVSEYTQRHGSGDVEAAFGLWRGRRSSGLAYERRLRREW